MDKVVFYWSGFEPIARIFVVGILAYIAIVIFLRISGKRTLARMTAFDFVITVAIGSAFGRILTAKTVALSEAIAAFLLLVLLQYLVSLLSLHWKSFGTILTAQPTLLFYNGHFIQKNMRRARIKEDHIFAAARKKGFSTLSHVEAIILESNGSFSVLKKSEKGERSYSELLEKGD